VIRDYDVDLDFVNSTENDAFEYNDEPAAATRIDEGGFSGRLVGSEQDYFTFDLTNREAVTFDYSDDSSFPVDDEGANFRLYRVTPGNELSQVQSTGIQDSSARFVYDVETNATFVLELDNARSVIRDYDVDLDFVNSTENDAFEYNDEPAAATPLFRSDLRGELGEPDLSGRLVGSEQDYFRFEVEATESVNVSYSDDSSFPADDEGLALRLYRVEAGSDLRQVQSTGISGSEARLDYDVESSGTFVLEVDNTRSLIRDYGLDFDGFNGSVGSPTADAGGDLTVEPNATVELDATGSTDPAGDTLAYAWTQVSGPSVVLTGASTATPSFAAPSVTGETTLVFEVTVTAGDRSATDRVTVTVRPETTSNPFPEGVPGVPGGPPTDPDGDGTFEDVNGDDEVDFGDVIDLLFALGSLDGLSAEQRTALDFDANGAVDFGDVIDLLFAL
jgi:hypothetical protein